MSGEKKLFTKKSEFYSDDKWQMVVNNFVY